MANPTGPEDPRVAGSVEVYRSSGARMLGGLLMGTCAVLLVTVGVAALGGAGTDDLVGYAGPLVLLAVAAHAALWSPFVEVGPAGVVMRNIVRTVSISWPAIREVDGRYGLRLETTHGRYAAWAAPAPAGMSRARGEDGEAAIVVRRRWHRLQEAGHLGSGIVETEGAVVTWHPATIAALLLAAGLTAGSIALG